MHCGLLKFSIATRVTALVKKSKNKSPRSVLEGTPITTSGSLKADNVVIMMMGRRIEMNL